MASVDEAGGSKFVFLRPFPEQDEYFLSDSLPFLVCLVIAYLAYVLKIGPDYMKNREPYKLKNTILVYNAIQVILSAYFVYLSLLSLIPFGFFPETCVEDDPEKRKVMIYAVYIYFLGKITELLDTVFFVLRKKYNQVSFLHVYHHSSVIVGTWLMFRYSISQTAVYAAFINSLVHVVMYFYYFMAALGPQYQKYLTWKKHITTFQLVQFVSMFCHQVIMLLRSKNCTHSVAGLIYVFYSTVLFFKLFSNFYNQSYNKAQKKGESQRKSQNEINNDKTQNDTTVSDENKIKAN
ncbi:hypothetical protein ABMA27_015606 [Loxostege sticticalis]|uniref:Elongation of very long chain fatty acids protein n=1 Tax=Loxostege sticticalis TaxID=481309 RepID=A0ABR3I8A5_LOXSC